ncbi:MAG: adenosylcobinamide-phosphate synthase CbiB [Proteobacteria bacterium]|nr:adenosylcobinamide-phosphate synthase CbiB [Pseudomonadota bacterium]
MSLAAWIGGPGPLLILVTALVLDGLLPPVPGPFRYLPHPVRVLGGVVGFLDRKLNRANRSETSRMVRGALAATVTVSLAGGFGWLIAWAAGGLPFGWIWELLLVTSLLAQRSLFDHARAVLRPLQAGDLAGARAAVAHLVGRDPESLDRHGVARATVESLAENFSDGVLAPAFWYLVLGLPGLCAYKAMNTLDSMIGYRTPRHASFGMVSARLDDLANLIPARIAAGVIALAALFTPSTRPFAALRAALRDAPRHRSPNAGWPEAAFAGALGLALAGPRRYGGKVVEDAWMGDGRARLEATDLRRALGLFAASCLVQLGIVAGIAVLITQL